MVGNALREWMDVNGAKSASNAHEYELWLL